MVSFSETEEVGVYSLSTPKSETKIAVNLMDADESDLTPRPLPSSPGRAAEATPPVPVQRELWPIFVLAALVLLLLEGLLYWRRQSAGRLRLPPRRAIAGRWPSGGRWSWCWPSTFLRPTLPRWVDRLNVVFLLDASDSVSLAARERAYRFVAEAVKHIRSGDRESVIVFGEEAVVDQRLAHRKAVDRPKSPVAARARISSTPSSWPRPPCRRARPTGS